MEFLQKTGFNHEIFHTEIIESSFVEDYKFYKMSAWNSIIIGEKVLIDDLKLGHLDEFPEHQLKNGVELKAHYETGDAYHHGNYDLPINKFVLNTDSSSSLLILLDELYESDFDDKTRNAVEALEEFKSKIPFINTLDKLFELYIFLRENEPTLNDFDLSEEVNNIQ